MSQTQQPEFFRELTLKEYDVVASRIILFKQLSQKPTARIDLEEFVRGHREPVRSTLLNELKKSVQQGDQCTEQSDVLSECRRRVEIDSLPIAEGFRIEKLLKQGGMGQVFRAHCLHLERPVVVKVLLPNYKNNVRVRDQFESERVFLANLSHPGIPPIYHHGSTSDGLPFFAMKLVEGETLLDLLKERRDSSHDLPRFLGIFERICQTVAYAHSCPVIHRDLKPDNVMVGKFAEVQVMDWGLAKRLATCKQFSGETRGGTTAVVGQESQGTSQIDSTQAGRALGTPPYMSPEQARGEIAKLDERCDVFGLGAILCEILTGNPPFWSRIPSEVMDMAKKGNLVNAFVRLDSCGADPELIGLSKKCLAPSKEDRLRDAGVVAKAVTQYQTQVSERLRQAELQNKETEVRIAEEQKRRQVERQRNRITFALVSNPG